MKQKPHEEFLIHNLLYSSFTAHISHRTLQTITYKQKFSKSDQATTFTWYLVVVLKIKPNNKNTLKLVKIGHNKQSIALPQHVSFNK